MSRLRACRAARARKMKAPDKHVILSSLHSLSVPSSVHRVVVLFPAAGEQASANIHEPEFL